MVVRIQAMPSEPIKPIVLDTTIDYNEGVGAFYARSDIDHKVYIPINQVIYANPDTGEIKTEKEVK